MPGSISDAYGGPDDDGDWFVIIHAPSGPLIMTRDDGSPVPPIALYRSLDEATEAAENNAAAEAYGAEAFQLGCGECT